MTLLSSLRIVAAFGMVAHAPSQDALKFEVASIKPADPAVGGHSSVTLLAGGALKVGNNSLKQLIAFAYDVRDFQVLSGPGWLDSARYDILAKADHEDGPAEFRDMNDAQQKTAAERTRERLRMLLAERFQLVIHRESKDVPVYALVVGKSGPKLEDSKEGISMRQLANMLSGHLRKPVLDRTGLAGKYKFRMSWTPDLSARGPDGPGNANLADSAGPSIFTAVQEQLGLRLESTKGPVEIIIVDRVEKASEN
jgi:hypothetical protein